MIKDTLKEKMQKQQYDQITNGLVNNVFTKEQRVLVYEYVYQAYFVEKKDFIDIFKGIGDLTKRQAEYCSKRVSTIFSKIVSKEDKARYLEVFTHYYQTEKIKEGMIIGQDIKPTSIVKIDFDIFKQQILELVSKEEHTYGERFICVLLCTGLRKSDVRTVQIQNVDGENIYLKYLTKKPIGDETLYRTKVLFPQYLDKIVKYINQIGQNVEDYFYSNMRIKNLVSDDMKYKLDLTFGYGFCENILKETDPKGDSIALHRLRSLYAYLNIYDKGYPEQCWVKEINNLLHHSTLDASMFYIKYQPAKFDQEQQTCFGTNKFQKPISIDSGSMKSISSMTSEAGSQELQQKLEEKDEIIRNLLKRIEELELKNSENGKII